MAKKSTSIDLQSIFEEIKKSFPEVRSTLIPFDKKSFMVSNSLNEKIYFNQKLVDEFALSKSALRGVLAHELAHKIEYKQKGFFYRILTIFKYNDSNPEFKRKSERDADAIAVERGFGKELIQLAREYPKERYEKRIKPFHLSISEIEALMKKKTPKNKKRRNP